MTASDSAAGSNAAVSSTGTGSAAPADPTASERRDSTVTASPDTGNTPAANGAVPLARPVLPVSLLAAHPGNVREDLQLDEEFLASIAANGVLVPIRIAPDDSSEPAAGEDAAPAPGYVVIDGHRRLAGAVKAGLTEVPVDLADASDGTASQYLDMFTANRHRRGLTPLEEADALFAAAREGASKTRIRTATGLSRDEVANALKAGRLSRDTRLKTAACYDMNLEQYALLQEFDGDQDAVAKLLEAFGQGASGHHTAERIRAERQAEAEADKALARYRDDGYQVSTDALPDGAVLLQALAHDGEDLTPDHHGTCPGRGIIFRTWAPDHPVHYCAAPAASGHQPRHGTAPAGDSDLQGESGSHPALPLAHPEPQAGPSLKSVIEGNRDWAAAAAVRHAFLTTMLARRTATRDMALFAASQLLTMPGPLRSRLTTAPHRDLFTELTGSLTPDRLGTWTTGKLPMLSLALIVTAYEEQLGGEGGKLTWRRDKFSPCSQDDAGTYFRFLVSTGYELSPIEQAIADGVEYTASSPDAPPLAEPASRPSAGSDTDSAPQDDSQAA